MGQGNEEKRNKLALMRVENKSEMREGAEEAQDSCYGVRVSVDERRNLQPPTLSLLQPQVPPTAPEATLALQSASAHESHGLGHLRPVLNLQAEAWGDTGGVTGMLYGGVSCAGSAVRFHAAVSE